MYIIKFHVHWSSTQSISTKCLHRILYLTAWHLIQVKIPTFLALQRSPFVEINIFSSSSDSFPFTISSIHPNLIISSHHSHRLLYKCNAMFRSSFWDGLFIFSLRIPYEDSMIRDIVLLHQTTADPNSFSSSVSKNKFGVVDEHNQHMALSLVFTSGDMHLQ